MKYVVVDLEMNRVSKEYKNECYPCIMEVIEIGAVALDENYQEISNFKVLVKPVFNDVIEKRYERLTGITTQMVENAPDFEDALGMFLSWCHSLKSELQICQWSESDLEQITKEMILKDVRVSAKDQEFLTDWVDFQREFCETLGVDRAISLKAAINYAGIDVFGRLHDALFDAKNTAMLLEIVRDETKRAHVLGNVIESFTETSIGSSLGDLFNFGNFVLAS